MPSPVKIALNINFVKPHAVVRVCQAAEQLGYHHVWLGEHLAMPTEGWWLDYPAYQQAVKNGTDTEIAKLGAAPPTAPFGDPLITLAAVAGATSRIRLGTGIYLLPMRNPIVAARAITGLDNISGGRLDLAVGLGWSEREFQNVGVPWEQRGKRFEESIHSLRILFQEEKPEFHGELIDFGPTGFYPKPVQNPFPIRLGGSGPKGTRRAALLGNGWFGHADQISLINDIREEAGLAQEPYDFIALTRGVPDGEALDKLAAMGADYASCNALVKPMGLEAIEVLERYARDVGLEPTD